MSFDNLFVKRMEEVTLKGFGPQLEVFSDWVNGVPRRLLAGGHSIDLSLSKVIVQQTGRRMPVSGATSVLTLAKYLAPFINPILTRISIEVSLTLNKVSYYSGKPVVLKTRNEDTRRRPMRSWTLFKSQWRLIERRRCLSISEKILRTTEAQLDTEEATGSSADDQGSKGPQAPDATASPRANQRRLADHDESIRSRHDRSTSEYNIPKT